MSTTPSIVFISNDTSCICVPSQMGTQRYNQLTGSSAEQLIELAGRVCYDSLGKGRSSIDYHKHLLQSKHWSVHEHVHVTIETTLDPIAWLNVRDVFIAPSKKHKCVRATFNMRHALESASIFSNYVPQTTRTEWQLTLMHVMQTVCPNIVYWHVPDNEVTPYTIVKSESKQEIHMSVFLSGSRVFSHEMVRHRGNISQRSGRYVDESGTPIEFHPLMEKWGSDKLDEMIDNHYWLSKSLYRDLVDHLSEYAQRAWQLDTHNARKQARSAARFFLPNGLQTEMIFTASLAHWDNIFAQRINPAADLEIAEIMAKLKLLFPTIVTTAPQDL